MKDSRVQKSVGPSANSEPDATPDNHYCLGPGKCPKCRRGRSRIASHPDRPRTPNHYCLGPGCPKCNTTPDYRRALPTLSLPAGPFHFVTSHDDSAIFGNPAHFSDS
ncbi:hypothetical protein M758_8G096600 [Ceratodon purpureus]|uniref:Uncharacterized protein n=1 Tax=Ceratodon purpureus TaxID=3225 RepID=A0A8T0H1T5_CERPU|nr:hypothetical protein KC19_8G100900 [Ceratodon purpureus]KAG0608318.1 hypothetical protein M758_8G096600 [Ceratodon purpureus]